MRQTSPAATAGRRLNWSGTSSEKSPAGRRSDCGTAKKRQDGMAFQLCRPATIKLLPYEDAPFCTPFALLFSLLILLFYHSQNEPAHNRSQYASKYAVAYLTSSKYQASSATSGQVLALMVRPYELLRCSRPLIIVTASARVRPEYGWNPPSG